MHVVHLTGGDLDQGAHRGAYWLHKGLIEIGVKSTILAPIPMSHVHDGVVSVSKSRLERIEDTLGYLAERSLVRLYPKRTHLFSSGLFGRNVNAYLRVADPDVVNIHWVARGPVSIRRIGAIQSLGKPSVWTLRDMWPFTGGCHYSLNCERYMTGCGACPQLGSEGRVDLSRLVYKCKQRWISPETRIVGISDWISQCARKSQLFKDFDIRTIPNCVDTDAFRPIDKKLAKTTLGVPVDKQIVLLGAGDVTNFYKGFDSFVAACDLLRRDDLLVLVFGNIERNRASEIPVETRELGHLDDEALRLAYSAADVFVAPSWQEAFGKTLAEAMSCGTPVVCFDSTGPRDIVVHKVTGYKAVPFQTRDLAQGIHWVLDHAKPELLGAASSERARKMFNPRSIARSYLELYEELVRGLRETSSSVGVQC